jgi:hypothetical protein
VPKGKFCALLDLDKSIMNARHPRRKDFFLGIKGGQIEIDMVESAKRKDCFWFNRKFMINP